LRVEVCEDASCEHKAVGALVTVTDVKDTKTYTTDGAGNADLIPVAKGPITVKVMATGFALAQREETVGDSNLLMVVVLASLIQPPLPIHASGRTFRTEDYDIWRYRGASAFTLLGKYIRGDDLTSFFSAMRGLKVNTLRVLSRVSWGVPLNPATVPNYLEKLRAFLALLESEGFRAELVGLADCAVAGFELPRGPQQTAYVNSLLSVLAEHPYIHFFELGNEYSVAVNGWSPADFTARPNFPVLMSRGSGGGEVEPPNPPWDYITYHSGRDAEWPRKQGKQACEYSWGCGTRPAGWENVYVPAVDDETMGAASEMKSQRSNVPLDFYNAHGLSSLFVAGSTLHGDALRDANVPTGRELECYEAAAQAWADVPLDAPQGMYTRGGLPMCPLEHSDTTALRTFCQLSAGPATCIVVRKQYPGDPVPRLGYTITNLKGTDHSLAFLTK